MTLIEIPALLLQPRKWKATAVFEFAHTETVFFDTNVVSALYKARTSNRTADPWQTYLNLVGSDRRVLNEVVLWELRKRFRGDDWEAWRKRQFKVVRLDQRVLERFYNLFSNIFRGDVILGSAPDGIVAAHCLARNWILATDNVRDFWQIPGLRLLVPPTWKV